MSAGDTVVGDTVVGDTVVGDTVALRSTLAGLLSLAAAEELILLAATVYRAASDGGRPDRWAAIPLVAHNNHFKRQQAERLAALAAGQVPATYGDVDHSSAEVYRGYAAQPAAGVMAECRRVSADLIDRMWALPDEDLLDPARHPWLNGRLLWLQIIVRGFWHATGHLGDYYLAHGQPERAIALQTNALGTARYLRAPAAAAGLAGYSLACAQARTGLRDEAARTLAEAIEANPDLRANAGRDPDLTGVRTEL
jgi:tetratricopeptide (TPR) repeat protein